MTRLDSSAAWTQAARMVTANREMLAAIAGVFFLLPGLIGAVVLPKPMINRGMSDQQMAEAFTKFYGDAGPTLALLSLPLIVGFMTMLVIMLDDRRPTVAVAIGQSLRMLPSYLAAHIVTMLAFSLVWLLLASVLLLALPAVLAVLLSIAAMTYPLTLVLMVAPEIAVAQTRNPFVAIRRSLTLTRGQFQAIMLYFAPAFTLFLVIYGLVMMVVGVVLVNTTEGEAQRLISETVVGLLFAVGYTYFAAMIASTHRQLAGDVAATRDVFD
ncbi:hypothetical protein [Novosphingobium sp.]|uniref:hypothetical protein n=1 Tax=Novosphingobium sp. TaxID=1874826 RepID=UPI0038BA9562